MAKGLKAKMSLFLDSGAPSLYNELSRGGGTKGKAVMGSFYEDRKFDDFSFLESQQYKDHKKRYVEFVKANEKYLDVYVNLDIIHNAEETWKNQLELEAAGIHPLPVFHLGSDLKWLRMLLDKGYKYIAMGGLIPDPPSVICPALDKIWGEILTDKKGFPKVKVHGFGITSPKVLVRYPWFSVDSSSWLKIGVYGSILLPKKSFGKFVYDSSPSQVFVSSRSGCRNEDSGRHYDSLSKFEQETVKDYILSLGVPFGKSYFKEVKEGYVLKEGEREASKGQVEVIEENGVCTDFHKRNKVNLYYYLQLGASVPEWPWSFKRRGFGL
ncbi:MAG: hypothetical protein WC302_00720 [Candidatus Paceibacterota bacterium]|jgi:hypothetical protein